MRVIRAPRGTELTAKSWLTEAPLAHADEQPRPRGRRAAGGAGGLRRHRPRRARLGDASTASSRRCSRLEDDETLLVQSGKPVGVFRTHADAPRVLIANSNLVPHWATWDHFHELDRKGLMMYGQMTAGSWIYIGTQGIVQGTYETFVEMGRQHYGGDLCGPLDPDRRPGRHGRRAAAGGDHGRRLDAGRRMPALAASRCACAPAISTSRRQDLDEALAIIDEATAASEGPSRSACSATPPRSCPSWCGAASGPTSSPTRPPRTIRSTAICRRAGRSSSGTSAREQRSRRASSRPRKASMAEQVRAMLDFHHAGVPDRRLRQQHPPDGARGGRRRRLRFPGLRAGLYPPAVLPRHRAVPLGRAVGRSGGHLSGPTPR